MSARRTGGTAGQTRLVDVAREAGVSISVVSRVLRDDANLRVRPETRARVLQVAERLDYRPHAAARSLRTSAAGAVGIFLPNLTNPIFTSLMQGIEDGCDAVGLTPLIGRSERLHQTNSLLERMVREGRIDAAMVQVTDDSSPTEARRIARDIPTVFLNSYTLEWAASVMFDDAEWARVGTRHLVEAGHSRIALVGGTATHEPAIRREQGFRAALAAAQLEVPDRWVARVGFTTEDGAAGFARIFARDERPTAIVVANVNAAIGVIDEARSEGFRVPGDVSVIAVGDSDIASHSWPPLTTVPLPLYELGLEAVRQVHHVIAGGMPQQVIVREPAAEVLVRESVANA